MGLELAAGEKPRPGDVSLPSDTPEKVREWAEGEEIEERERERQELLAELMPAMESRLRLWAGPRCDGSRVIRNIPKTNLAMAAATHMRN